MSTTKGDTKMAKNEMKSEVAKLFAALEGANEATRKRIIDSLPEETLSLLRKESNPYKVPVYQNTKHAKGKQLCFGVINLREKYAERFAMTALIGFIYRMLEEFSPKSASDLPSQNDSAFATVLNRRVKELKRSRPEEICREEIRRLREIVSGATEATKEIKQAYYDLQMAQARLIKYKLYFFSKDKEELKFQLERDELDLSRAKSMRDNLQHRLDVTVRKLELRREFEKTPAAKEFESVALSKMDLRQQTVPDYSKEDPKRCNLSEYDKLHDVANFEAQVVLRKKETVALDDDVAKLTSIVSGKQDAVEKINVSVKELNTKMNELRTLFSQKFPNVSQGEGKGLNFDVAEYVETDDEYDSIVAECKKELRIELTKEEAEDQYRDQVLEFLDNYFLYNPDIHVQSGYKPNYEDELRTPLITKTLAFQRGERTESEHKQDLADHAASLDKYRVIAETKVERSVIPPDDTFFRFKRYTENNYEELRQATDDIYCEKSDLEFSIVPLAVFKGADAKDRADEWQRMYADEYEGDVYQATFGMHNLLGNWVQNREKREFYTKNSEIIKRIIKQSEDDQKLGRRLMKDRAQKKKADNEKEAGPDPVGLKEYTKKHLIGGLEEGGAKHVSDIDTSSAISEGRAPSVRDINRDELDSINDSHESSRKEIEVGWKHIRPQKRGKRGRRTGQTDTGKFHIPAESPETGLTKGYKMEPEDMHRHLNILDMKKSIREAVVPETGTQ